jgi:hypothetical protein
MKTINNTLSIPIKSYDNINNEVIFPSNKEYVFEIQLCNFMSSCGYGSHRVYIQDSSNNANIPTSTIAGPSYIELYRSQVLKLSADAYISNCDGSKSRKNIKIKWTVLRNNIPDTDLISIGKNPFQFVLPAYSFTPSHTYIVKCTVNNKDSIETRSSTVVVFIKKSPLVAIISKQQNDGKNNNNNNNDIVESNEYFIRPSTTLILDASNSYDADYPPFITNQIAIQNVNLNYKWSCRTIAPSLSDVCAFPFQRHDTRDVMHLSYDDTLSVNATAILTLMITNHDDSSSAESSVLLHSIDGSAAIISLSTPSSSSSSSSSMKHATSRRLIINAQVDFDTNGMKSGSISWAVTPSIPSFVIPITRKINNNNNNNNNNDLNFGLVVPANSEFSLGIDYNFKLTCILDNGIKSSSDITITINEPPLPGSFHVTYKQDAKALKDDFKYEALYWNDDDLPLSYAFGYYDLQSKFLVTRNKLENKPTATILLPVVDIITKTTTCVAMIYDSLDANSTSTDIVTVLSVDMSKPSVAINEYKDIINNTFSNSEITLNIDQFRNTINIVSSSLNTVNCSLPSILIKNGGCISLNRQDCSNTAYTCGPCYNGYYGDNGDANTKCFDPKTTLTSTINNIPLKECSGKMLNGSTCNNHGLCHYTFTSSSSSSSNNIDTSLSSSSTATATAPTSKSCTIIDDDCEAICKCDNHYTGISCKYTTTELVELQSITTQLINSLSDIITYDDISPEVVSNQLNMLRSMSINSDTLDSNTQRKSIEIVDSIFDSMLSTGTVSEESIGIAFDITSNLFNSILNNNNNTSNGRRRRLSETDSTQKIQDTLNDVNKVQFRDMLVGEDDKINIDNNFQTIITAPIGTGDSNILLEAPKSSLEIAKNAPSKASINITSGNGVGTGKSLLRTIDRNAYSINNNNNGDNGNNEMVSSGVRFETEMNYEKQCNNKDDSFFADIVISFMTPQLYSASTIDESYRIRCRPYVNESGIITCKSGYSKRIHCPGNNSIEKIVDFTCPQNQLKPSCQNLLSSSSSSSSSYCNVIAFTDYNTTCRCDMCQAKLTNNNNNRLLLSVEDSGYVEIGAMSSFVLKDAFSTLAENGDLTSAAAFNEAIIVVLAFGFLWGCILALIIVAETMHRIKKSKFKRI